MKPEDVEVGMMVRISKDISKTVRRHTASSEMHKMKGKLYRIHSKHSDGIRFLVNDRDWIFCYEDIEEPPLYPPIPEVLFDPKDLYLRTK